MKVHNLKLNEEFADAILSGEKSFEIRENDRGFQKGDHIVFRVIKPNAVFNEAVNHPLKDKEFEIGYVINGWGLENGYVAFSIREVAVMREEANDGR